MPIADGIDGDDQLVTISSVARYKASLGFRYALSCLLSNYVIETKHIT